MSLLAFVALLSVFPYYIFSENKPLRQRLLSLGDCDPPPGPYDPQHRVVYAAEVWTRGRRSYVNGTFCVARKTPPVKYYVRGFKVDKKGRKTPDFAIDELSCNNPVIAMLLRKCRVRYNKDDCTGLPGNYTSEVMSLDQLSKTYKYMVLGVGTYTFELEFRTANGVIICLAATIEVEK